jgi:hypothetical protein
MIGNQIAGENLRLCYLAFAHWHPHGPSQKPALATGATFPRALREVTCKGQLQSSSCWFVHKKSPPKLATRAGRSCFPLMVNRNKVARRVERCGAWQALCLTRRGSAGLGVKPFARFFPDCHLLGGGKCLMLPISMPVFALKLPVLKNNRKAARRCCN